jgi:murein DD-endopeptidase MepM/ murein hydrolase activator NlpD
MKILLLSFLFLSSVFGLKHEVSSTQIKNGQTALIKFSKDEDTEYKYIKIAGKRYDIFSDIAYIPVSYYEKPKKLKVEVFYTKDGKSNSKEIFFEVIDGDYKKETLSVDGSKVKLSKKDKQRTRKEYAEAMKIYNTVTEEKFTDSDFIMPIDSKITSDFGNARVFNGSLKSYHSGTDFRAKVGTPIKSANDGVVVLASDRFYAGGSIIIDHGHGIYSCYYHMSRFDVKEGQKVDKGQIIGLSGKSGRVTGPHLHFSLRVGGVQVDPLQFINLANKEL